MENGERKRQTSKKKNRFHGLGGATVKRGEDPSGRSMKLLGEGGGLYVETGV